MSRKRHRKEPCPCAECNGDLRDTRTKKRHVYKEQQAQQVLQEMREVALPELEREEENNEEMLNDESEVESASEDEMETTHQILELPNVRSPIFPTDPESTLTVGCVVMLVCHWWVANKASIRSTSHIWRFTRTPGAIDLVLWKAILFRCIMLKTGGHTTASVVNSTKSEDAGSESIQFEELQICCTNSALFVL